MSSTWSSFRSRIQHGRSKIFPSGEMVSKIPMLDMLAHNWSLGFTSFGGPTVHFQIFHRLFVDDFKWLDEATYQEKFALCQALSGPGSTKMIYGINVLHYGFFTGLLAFVIWSLPMAIAAFGLAVGIGNVGEELPRPVYALLSGLNSATVGIIALAAIQLSRKAVTDTLTRVIVLLGGTAGMLYNALWYFPVLMVAGGIATILWDLKLLHTLWERRRKNNNGPDNGNEEGVELEPVGQSIQDSSSSVQRRPNAQTITQKDRGQSDIDISEPTADQQARSKIVKSWRVGAIIIAAFLLSFIVVMICRGLLSRENRGFDLFANLYLAGTIIFGGWRHTSTIFYAVLY
jgi:chromate transport protein ChrA